LTRQHVTTYALDAPLSGSGDPALLGDILGEDDPALSHATDIEAESVRIQDLLRVDELFGKGTTTQSVRINQESERAGLHARHRRPADTRQ
jgi:hypothetical protein